MSTFELVLYGATGLISILVALGVGNWTRKKMDILFDDIAAKTKLKFISNLDEIALGFVVDAYFTVVKNLKERKEWNREVAEDVRHEVVEKVKQHFGFKALAQIAGRGTETEINNLVASRVEKAVQEVKKTENPSIA